MAIFEKKSFNTPEEVQPFEAKGQAEAVTLGGRRVLRRTFEPGWRWSEHLKPIVGTDSCQAAHLLYCQSGRMRLWMDDGTEAELGPGDVVQIPPGHDSEVIGDEPCIFIDFGEVAAYAHPGSSVPVN